MHSKQQKPFDELIRASIAGIITIIGAVILAYFLPDFREYMVSRNDDNRLQRGYEKNSEGGYIIYQNEAGIVDERYVEDLEILSRRFGRGHFEMISIPGSAEAGAVVEMREISPKLRYTITRRENKPALQIQTTPANAKSVHKYLDFLDERWK